MTKTTNVQQPLAGISLDMLIAFSRVAETLNVSATALALGIGKSIVSKRVAQLEERLGAILFSRTTRRISLTPAGEAYLEHARRALTEVSQGIERLHAMRSELTGLIRITAPISWGQHVLARVLPEFLRLHPSIQVELHLEDQMVDLAAQRYDFAMRWSGKKLKEFKTIPMMKIGWLLTASPQYLNVHGRPTNPDALAGHSCMAYWRQRSDEIWTLKNLQQEICQVQVRGRYHVDNPDAVAHAAIAGLGIALLPDYLCNQALQNGQLEVVMSDWLPQTKYGSHINVLGAPERMALSRNQVIIKYLRSQFLI